MNSNGRNTGIHELMMSNEGVRRDILSLCSDFHVLNPRFSSFRLNDGSSCTKKLLIAFIGLEKSVKFEERKLQRFGSSARIADRRQGVPSIWKFMQNCVSAHWKLQGINRFGKLGKTAPELHFERRASLVVLLLKLCRDAAAAAGNNFHFQTQPGWFLWSRLFNQPKKILVKCFNPTPAEWMFRCRRFRALGKRISELG